MDNTPELQAVERKSDYEEHLSEMIKASKRQWSRAACSHISLSRSRREETRSEAALGMFGLEHGW